MSMDDLYNNLKVYEPEIKWMSNSVSEHTEQAPYGIGRDEVEMANGNLTMRLERFLKNTGKEAYSNSNENIALNNPNIAIRELMKKLEIAQKEKDSIQFNVDEFENASKSLDKLISEEENVSQTKTEKKTVKPSIAKIEFVKPKQQEKTARKTVKQVEKHRQNTHSPRGNKRNWNNMMSQKLGSNFEMFNKACYVCGSFDHLQVDCNYHQKQFQNQRKTKPIWNNSQRVNHQNFAKKTHPCTKKNMVPRAVLMKSGLVSVNTARQVNTAHSKTTVNDARPMSYLSKTAHSTVKRPIHKNTVFKNSNINQRVNIVRGKNVNTARLKAVVNAIKGNNFNVVKASTCWVWKPKHKVLDHLQGVIDSGCSRHMTWNMSYLTNYEEIDGGYVAFVMELELILAKTINGEVQLHALVDGKKIIVTESTVRRDLQLEDAEDIDCLPNSTILEELTRMSSKTTAWNEFSSTMASAIICLATN
ncbi:hypothetical protein Tco_0442229 [Tanacetum coccineum]